MPHLQSVFALIVQYGAIVGLVVSNDWLLAAIAPCCAGAAYRGGPCVRAPVVVALAAPAVWAWYMSGRQLAATTKTEQPRVLGLGVVASAGVGVVILALGVAGFVLTGYDWVGSLSGLVGRCAASWVARLGVPQGLAADRPSP